MKFEEIYLESNMRRNPIAADLRQAKYRPRIVRSKRLYNRARGKRIAKGGATICRIDI